jgi:ribosomal protein S18 acetylase RimI-like enzyme
MQIQSLGPSEYESALALICEAFRSHPMLPQGIPYKVTQDLFRFMFDEFGAANSACLHGIKDADNHLLCVALTLSSTDEPGLWDAIRCTYAFFRILGWRLALAYLKMQTAKPKSTVSYLELVLMGTIPTAQKGGLGRKMLRHLLQYAQDKGYAGMTLEVAQNAPAFGFYCREGFTLEKTIYLKDLTVCIMRLKLDEKSKHQPHDLP